MPKLSPRSIKIQKYCTILKGLHKMCACKRKTKEKMVSFFINCKMYPTFKKRKKKNFIEDIHIRMNNSTDYKLTLFYKKTKLHTFPCNPLKFTITNKSPSYSHL